MKNRLLERIVATKRDEVRQRKRAAASGGVATTGVGDPVRAPVRSLRRSLAGGSISVIAEIKRRSPSRGELRVDLDVARIASTYQSAGAAAISVLTDGPFFGGSDDDLVQARAACSLPILRKDFTLDEYQIEEARRIGADAVLLIVRLLGRERLDELLRCARGHGLEALVEVHTAEELAIAVDSGAEIIGINSRDLDTFETDLDRALQLADALPPGRVSVAESGIRDPGDVARAAAAGFDAVLVGETLMRADDPASTLAALREAGP